jgi:hypothetical protein
MAAYTTYKNGTKVPKSVDPYGLYPARPKRDRFTKNDANPSFEASRSRYRVRVGDKVTKAVKGGR